MQRILFTIPVGNGIPVFGYGLFLMLGFVFALLWARARAKKAGVSTDATIDVGLLSVVAGVVGARLAFLFIDYHPEDGVGDIWEWLAVWQGGLTFQGGLFLALAANIIYLRRKRISVGRMFDVYAPTLALGVGFGRIGCFLNGCCWGRIAPAGSWLSMRFPDSAEPMRAQLWFYQENPLGWSEFVRTLGYSADTPPTIPVYATQLASAAGLFLMAAGLVWAERRWRNRADGQVIVWFLFAYGVGRFLVEFWRADTPLRYGFGAFPGLRLGQWLALIMLAAGVVFQIMLNRRNRSGKIADTEG